MCYQGTCQLSSASLKNQSFGFLGRIKGFKTTIAKASTIANSYRTTVPAAIMNQFGLKEGDKLDWELKAENGKIIIIIKPDKE